MLVTRAWEEGRDEGLVFNGCRASVWEMKMFWMEMADGDDCTMT